MALLAASPLTSVAGREYMDKFDRFQQLHRIFKSRRYPVSVAVLAERLECSEKTVKRSIEQMRDYLNAPLHYDSKQRGWSYRQTDGDSFELPGLWLTGEELQSLSFLIQVLEQFGEGLLNEELAVVKNQLHRLLEARGASLSDLAESIRVLPIGNRTIPSHNFGMLSEAILNRKVIEIRYRSYDNRITERQLSPQTLVHYRENWYLDAWCHLREELRTFSLARIEQIELTAKNAKRLSRRQLDEHFAASYGIFAGAGKHIARLRFLPAIAREIALQQWHPDQTGKWDGHDYLLSFPYSDERELVQDILRHVANVLVESPDSLKKSVYQRLKQAVNLYSEYHLPDNAGP